MTAPAFEELPMERLSPGIFKASLAMFPDPTGKYVRLSDALAAVTALTAIAQMDPDGVRADDLGRAARIANDAIRALMKGASQ